MLRQVTEAVHISCEKPTLNTKMEWRKRIMNQVEVDVNRDRSLPDDRDATNRRTERR